MHVDRVKTCPTLIRCFHREGGHVPLEEFGSWNERKEPTDELQIYTWPDATMRELHELVQEVLPVARKMGCVLGFSLVYADRRGEYVMRSIGRVGNRKHPDDNKTLQQSKYQPGDFLSISIEN